MNTKLGLIAVVQFPDRSWSGGGSITDSLYDKCDRYLVPKKACSNSVDDAISLVRRMTSNQKELLRDVTDVAIAANYEPNPLECFASEWRTAKSLIDKRILVLVGDRLPGKNFEVKFP